MKTSYRIDHTTTYTYDSDVTGSYGQLYLRPRDLTWQRCLAHESQSSIRSPPTCSATATLYGNTQVLLPCRAATYRARVTAISVIEMSTHDWLPKR